MLRENTCPIDSGDYSTPCDKLSLSFLARWKSLPGIQRNEFIRPNQPPVSSVGSSRQGCESRRVKVPPPSVAQNGRLAYPLLGEVTDRDMRGRKSHGRPVYYRNSGGSNLGGEQIYGPEDKQIIAASKDTHTEIAVWIKLSADRFNTSGRPLFCGKKWV